MNHLNAVWRITLGLGTVPPLLLLYFRLKMHEVSLEESVESELIE
jgi:hypothetical protein